MYTDFKATIILFLLPFKAVHGIYVVVCADVECKECHSICFVCKGPVIIACSGPYPSPQGDGSEPPKGLRVLFQKVNENLKKFIKHSCM